MNIEKRLDSWLRGADAHYNKAIKLHMAEQVLTTIFVLYAREETLPESINIIADRAHAIIESIMEEDYLHPYEWE